MLLRFAVTNYRGFRDRIEWDLSQPKNYSFNENAVKDGVIKNGIIYGPNGSGKSNFALALFDIVNHLSQKWKKMDYYANYVYGNKTNELVSFEYDFKFGPSIVKYAYQKNANGILFSEMMSVDGNMVFNRQPGSFIIDESEFPINDNLKVSLRENANNVSIANLLLTSLPLPQEHFLLQLQNFVNSMLWYKCLDQRDFIGLSNSATMNIEEYIINNNYVDDFSKFLKEISDQSFTFALSEKDDKHLYCVIDGSYIPFITLASTGTQSLELLYFYIKQMGQAKFVFIDEFDAFYHFRLAFQVCKRLFNLDTQVFTSSHNTYLMTNDLLRPDCNFILNEGVIKPLCDCTSKELRFGHNIEKLFRGNAFQI